MRMDFRKINRETMENTLELCSSLNRLKKSIEDSVDREYVLLSDDKIETGDIQANGKMKVLVSGKRTFEAAENYKGKKICCLDFANNHSIGGAPFSAGAQEESICRISTLYPCLCAKREEFYERHTRDFIAGKLDEMGNDDLIYVPDVTVFKTDESVPEMMDEDAWFKTDVIVSAAPVLDVDFDEARYRKIMESRIKRVLDVASKEKVQVLILGAFGCGAFNNPPEIVSEIFSRLIGKYDFETVEFAVFCRYDTKNFDVFSKTFG